MHSKTLYANIIDFISSSTSSLGLWAVYQTQARSHIFNVLREGLLIGQLEIEDRHGKHSFGKPTKGYPLVTVKVINESVWVRMALSSDLGLSEAYMYQDIDISNIRGLGDLYIANRQTLRQIGTMMSTITSYMSALAIRGLGRQSLSYSRANVEVAYDTSNDFFKCFLSKEMMYSCALWSDAENGVNGDLIVGPTEGDLEAAQARKIQHILKQSRVRPGDRLLEIGSGWGAMSITAALMGCTVDTVTLSTEQKAETEIRALEAGVSERVRVHLCDYRNLPASFEHAFDGFVSCEMVEAVGLSHHSEYFTMIDWALKPDRGSAVITATSQPEFRYEKNQPDDFGRHYHWPNTFLPSATSFASDMQSTVKGRMVLYSVENHAHHYSRTLREWSRRFEKNFQGKIVTDMQKKYPALQAPEALEAYKRKWRYLFGYAESGFASAYTAVNCWTFSRPCNPIE